MNSPAFLTGIARLCAEFGVVCVSLLSVPQTAFINKSVVGSKLLAFGFEKLLTPPFLNQFWLLPGLVFLCAAFLY